MRERERQCEEEKRQVYRKLTLSKTRSKLTHVFKIPTKLNINMNVNDTSGGSGYDFNNLLYNFHNMLYILTLWLVIWL